MTAGLRGLQTAAFLSTRGDVTAHGHASRFPQCTGSLARIGGATGACKQPDVAQRSTSKPEKKKKYPSHHV